MEREMFQALSGEIMKTLDANFKVTLDREVTGDFSVGPRKFAVTRESVSFSTSSGKLVFR